MIGLSSSSTCEVAGPQAVRAFAASTWTTATLLVQREIRSPRRHLDRHIAFADGTTSRVYRVTTRDGAPMRRPTLLVVQFRLRWAGRSRLLHALFRVESVLHTPLFAGFPGFRSKLWLTDEDTGVYRGVYEWDGADQALDYATTLSELLRVVSVPETVRFHVEPGLRPDDVLDDPGLLPENAENAETAERWWRISGMSTP